MISLPSLRVRLVNIQRSTKRAFLSRAMPDHQVAKVTLKVPAHLEFGASIAIAGLSGSWDVDSALKLAWTESDVWVGETDLPTGTNLECKYVIVKGERSEWQQGGNTVVLIPSGAQTAEISWQGTEVSVNVTQALAGGCAEAATDLSAEIQVLPEMTISDIVAEELGSVPQADLVDLEGAVEGHVAVETAVVPVAAKVAAPVAATHSAVMAQAKEAMSKAARRISESGYPSMAAEAASNIVAGVMGTFRKSQKALKDRSAPK